MQTTSSGVALRVASSNLNASEYTASEYCKQTGRAAYLQYIHNDVAYYSCAGSVGATGSAAQAPAGMVATAAR